MKVEVRVSDLVPRVPLWKRVPWRTVFFAVRVAWSISVRFSRHQFGDPEA